ncbi:MAG: cupredoxin domain-containing protein [Syntrophobacteraceae bacterium]
MRLDSKRSVFVIFVVIAALAGCADKGKVQTAAPMTSGGSMITIEADSHKFTPNKIQVEKTGLLGIEIRNVSGSQINFTLKDLHGKILKSVDPNPGGSVIVNVELPEPGVYTFYSNKALRSTLGMHGQIVVGR